MAALDRARLRRSLDLLQHVDLGQVAEGGRLHRSEPLYFNPRFGNCFRNYRIPHVAPEALRDSLQYC